MRVKTKIYLYILLMGIVAGFLTSCSSYVVFSSRLPELDFIFDYPRGWQIDITEDRDTLGFDIKVYDIGIWIESQNTEDEGPIQVNLLTSKKAFPPPEQAAQANIDYYLRYDGKAHNFKLLKQEKFILDGASGYVIEYTLEQPSLPKPNWYYIPLRKLCIEVPHNDKVYEIRVSSPPNQWNTHQKDIQHILDSFKWK